MPPAARTAWQPIETAPGNMTLVLLYHEDLDGITMGCGRFHAWLVRGEPHSGWFTDRGRVHPTHWMPLPSPPVAHE